MKKKLIVIVIVSLAVILFVSIMSFPAAAKDKPKHGDGFWYYMPVFDDIEPIPIEAYNGHKAFWEVPYASTWTGVFSGTSLDYGLVIAHEQALYPPLGVPMVFLDVTVFESVEVCGAVGDLELDVLGDRPDMISDWIGTWVITDGTGDLEGLEGHGTFWGPGYNGGDDPGEIYYEVDDLTLDGIKCKKTRDIGAEG